MAVVSEIRDQVQVWRKRTSDALAAIAPAPPDSEEWRVGHERYLRLDQAMKVLDDVLAFIDDRLVVEQQAM